MRHVPLVERNAMPTFIVSHVQMSNGDRSGSYVDMVLFEAPNAIHFISSNTV